MNPPHFYFLFALAIISSYFIAVSYSAVLDQNDTQTHIIPVTTSNILINSSALFSSTKTIQTNLQHNNNNNNHNNSESDLNIIPTRTTTTSRNDIYDDVNMNRIFSGGGQSSLSSGYIEIIDGKGSERSILLSDGYSRDQVQLQLNLPIGETLRKVRTDVNDTTIITSVDDDKIEHEQILDGAVKYNISVIHYFENSVGIARSIITARTSKNRVFSVMIYYYVTGFVGFQLHPDGNKEIITGFESKPVTFNSPRDVLLLADRDGYIRVPLIYQPPGPDVSSSSNSNNGNSNNNNNDNGGNGNNNNNSTNDNTDNNSNYRPSSLEEILSNTQVQVGGRTLGAKSPIVEQNNDLCKTLTIANYYNGKFKFENEDCGLGFYLGEKNNQPELIIRMKPYEDGYASILLNTPLVSVDGESLETSIRIFVKKPDFIYPFLLLDNDITITFDHYGLEYLPLEVNNSLSPPQMANATDYIIDMSNMRYGRSDFHYSRFDSDVQTIMFVTIQPDTQNVTLLKNLMIPDTGKSPSNNNGNGNQMYHQNRFLNPASFLYKLWNMPSSMLKKPLSLIKEEILILNREEYEKDDEEISTATPESSAPPNEIEASTEPQVSYHQSNLHVLLPPQETYRTGKIKNKSKFYSTIASKELATVKSYHNSYSHTYIRASIVLYDYRINNFSEHKSQQVVRSISRLISESSRSNSTTTSSTATDGILIRLRQRTASIIATYDVQADHNGSNIATSLTIQENGVSFIIERECMLRPGSTGVYDARVLPALSAENLNGAGEETFLLSGRQLGLIVAAIVALCLVLAIPITILLVKYLSNRSQRLGEQQEKQQLSEGIEDEAAGVDSVDGDVTNTRPADE